MDKISIHALREEGDLLGRVFFLVASEFLSTPSARRATRRRPRQRPVGRISIHALREEGDTTIFVQNRRIRKFLSTPSARRATACTALCGDTEIISIHALREEGDHLKLLSVLFHIDFYPRPPRGGRQHQHGGRCGLCGFLSTPSARRATIPRGAASCLRRISIHALREEGDVTVPAPESFKDEFLSTPSARRATKG